MIKTRFIKKGIVILISVVLSTPTFAQERRQEPPSPRLNENHYTHIYKGIDSNKFECFLVVDLLITKESKTIVKINHNYTPSGIIDQALQVDPASGIFKIRNTPSRIKIISSKNFSTILKYPGFSGRFPTFFQLKLAQSGVPSVYRFSQKTTLLGEKYFDIKCFGLKRIQHPNENFRTPEQKNLFEKAESVFNSSDAPTPENLALNRRWKISSQIFILNSPKQDYEAKGTKSIRITNTASNNLFIDYANKNLGSNNYVQYDDPLNALVTINFTEHASDLRLPIIHVKATKNEDLILKEGSAHYLCQTKEARIFYKNNHTGSACIQAYIVNGYRLLRKADLLPEDESGVDPNDGADPTPKQYFDNLE